MKKNACLVVIFVAACCFSCKKYVQQQEQNALVGLITNGTWYVQLYQQNGIDSTASFSSFAFHFHDDGSVTGSNGTVSVNGSWAGNLTDRTITSYFPAGSGILNDLDGIWKITDSGDDYVVANTPGNPGIKNLKLEKR